MTAGVQASPRVKGYLIQALMLLSINVPTISFGLAMGWVSLASGEGGEDGEGEEMTLVGAAAATFAAGLVGVPLGARALHAGRKPAVIATSAAFGVCWSLKLVGGWGVVAGRLVGGVAGAAAWCVSPLLAREMCAVRVRGAAVAALVLAHNLGVLLMYVAGDAGLHHRTVVVWCLGLSVVHCVTFLFAPESPAFLAASGKHKEARASLAWLRGVDVEHPSLDEELQTLPPPDQPPVSPFQLTKEMLSDRGRRRAFTIALVAVVGQEACGVLTLLQFAERVFVLARDEGGVSRGAGDAVVLASPARHALVLGAVQFAASGVALYLVERVGRRPLVIFGAVATGASLALGAVLVRAGLGGWGAGGALAAAVAADSLALQPAPYALLADMFHYQYRGCAVLLVTVAACLGNAAETLLFPIVAHGAGLWAALALAAAATLFYALFAIIWVPETKGRSPEEIYDAICSNKLDVCKKDIEHCSDANLPDKNDPGDYKEEPEHYLNNRNDAVEDDEDCDKVKNYLDTELSDSIKMGHSVTVGFDTVGDIKCSKKVFGITPKEISLTDFQTSIVVANGIENVRSVNSHSCIELNQESNDLKNEDTNKFPNDISIDCTNSELHDKSTCTYCFSADKDKLERVSSLTCCKMKNELKDSHKQANGCFQKNAVGICKNNNDSTSVVIVQTLQRLQTKCSEETQCTRM